MIKIPMIVLISVFFLTSCMSFSTSDIPTHLAQVDEITISKENRKNITFSVSYRQEVVSSNDYILTKEQDMAQAIRETFKKANLFNKIHYVSIKDASDYHFHFDVIVTGTDPQTQTAIALIGGYTLFLFPAWFNYNVDIVMHVLKNKNEVYAITAPQMAKDVFWLPFVITWPIFNHLTVGTYIEKKALSYFISEIIQNKLYDY